LLVIIFVSIFSFNLLFKFIISLDNDLLYGRANALFASEDYESAFQILSSLAEQDHARAQNTLGFLYQNGLGVPQDHAMAKHWYQKSANQNYTIAQYNLGIMYQYGLGVPQDYAKAEQWYKKSMEQGNRLAHRSLCRLYLIQEQFEKADKIDCPRK